MECPDTGFRSGLKTLIPHAWMKLLDEHGQCARTASDIEEALPGRKLHPLNKGTPDRVTAQQLGQRIVDG